MQLWFYLYFPEFRPKDHRLDELTRVPSCCCFASVQTYSSNFKTNFEYLYANHGNPCWTAIVNHLPDRPWFAVCQDSEEELGLEDKNIRRLTWSSCLVSKDLVVGFCPIEGFHKKSKLYCELDAANLCARQFGLLQGIPVFHAQSRNFQFPNRIPLLFPDEMVTHMSAQLSRDAMFSYELFSFTPDMTPAFTAWWDIIREKLFGRPLSDVLGLFSFIPTEVASSAVVQSSGAKRRLSPGTLFIAL